MPTRCWARASAPIAPRIYKGGISVADIQKLRRNLEAEGFAVSYFETAQEATCYLTQKLQGYTIGFGGSQTVQELGLYQALSPHNTCVWHWDKEKNTQPQEAAQTQVYISSLNGVSQEGELINIDGGGNRVASGLFGHEQLYFVIGVNKIAPNYDAALWRARNIAAPKNAQRLGRDTPCALRGDKCYNCHSPQRICAALTVYWQKPSLIPYAEVVIVNEPLGY